MNKNRVRLTESQLHEVIKESVNKVLSEIYADRTPEGIDKAIYDRNNPNMFKRLKDKWNSRNYKQEDENGPLNEPHKLHKAKTNVYNQARNLSRLYNDSHPERRKDIMFYPAHGRKSDGQILNYPHDWKTRQN